MYLCITVIIYMLLFMQYCVLCSIALKLRSEGVANLQLHKASLRGITPACSPAMHLLSTAREEQNVHCDFFSTSCCKLQDEGQHVVPGEQSTISFSFPDTTTCDRWLMQINDSRCWPCGSLQSALTRAEAFVSDQADSKLDEETGTSDHADSNGQGEGRVTGCEYLSQSSCALRQAWRHAEQLEKLMCPTAGDKGKMLVSMLQRLAPQEESLVKTARQLSQVTGCPTQTDGACSDIAFHLCS